MLAWLGRCRGRKARFSFRYATEEGSNCLIFQRQSVTSASRMTSDIPLDSHITLSLRSGLFGRTAYDTGQILRLLHQDIALLHHVQQVKRAEGRRHHCQQARASRASTSHQGHLFSPSYYAFLTATLGLTLTNHGSCPWAMTHQPSRCRPQREHQCEQQSRQREQCPRARKNSQRRDLLKCAAGRKPPIP